MDGMADEDSQTAAVEAVVEEKTLIKTHTDLDAFFSSFMHDVRPAPIHSLCVAKGQAHAAKPNTHATPASLLSAVLLFCGMCRWNKTCCAFSAQMCLPRIMGWFVPSQEISPSGLRWLCLQASRCPKAVKDNRYTNSRGCLVQQKALRMPRSVLPE